MDSYSSPTTKPLYKGTQIAWYLLSVLEILLAFRFVFKLLAANPSAGFTLFIYGITKVFVGPFLAVFSITKVEGATFEWTTLLAMFVYWLLVWLIVRLLVMSKTMSTTEAAEKLNKEDK